MKEQRIALLLITVPFIIGLAALYVLFHGLQVLGMSKIGAIATIFLSQLIIALCTGKAASLLTMSALNEARRAAGARPVN